MSNIANIVQNDIARAIYLVDANGNPITSTNALAVNATFSASSVAINDPTTTTQKMAVDASGNASVKLGAALPAGTNVIGHVIVDSAGSVSVTSLPALPAGSNAIGTVTANAGSGTFNTSQQATGSVSGTLQNGATGNGNGTSLNVLGMNTVVFTITGTFSGLVNFEGSEDGANYSALTAVTLGQNFLLVAAGGAGLYAASVAGLQTVRARISGYSSGSITVTAHAVPTPLTTMFSGVNLIDSNGTNKASIDSSGNLRVNVADTSATGSVTNDNDVVSIALPGGQATALIQITTSNLSGTLLFEASPDSGTTWYSVQANQVGTSTIATSVVGSGGSQAAGAWRAGCAGFTNFRVRLHPTTSGTATILLRLSAGVHNVVINNATALGQATMANSAPVVLASDEIVPIKGSFTEVIGNGPSIVNGVNTDLISSTDVSAYKWLSLQITGTYSGTLTFQGSNDNTNFNNVGLCASAGFTAANALSATASSNNIYAGPVQFRYFRVRMTSYTSNSSLAGTLELYTHAPSLFVTSLNASLQPTTSGGCSDFHLISAATTNATNIKSSAGQMYGYTITNTNAALRYVKLHNTAGTPTAGSGVIYTIGIPPTSTVSLHIANGIAFGTGIGITTVTGIADSDTNAVGASDLSIDLVYK